MIRGALLTAGVAAAFVTAGCDGAGTASNKAAAPGATRGAAASPSARPATPSINTDWARNCPIPDDAPRAPMGRTAAELIAVYGPTAHDETFVLGEQVDLVRMSVRNVLSAPEDLKRNVREMIWRARGCELTVWLAEKGGREVAVQTARLPEGSES